jgi:hypothetical protein
MSARTEHGAQRSASAAARLAIGAAVSLGSVAQATPSWPELSAPPSVAAEGSNDAAVNVAVEVYLFVPPVEGARRNAVD